MKTLKESILATSNTGIRGILKPILDKLGNNVKIHGNIIDILNSAAHVQDEHELCIFKLNKKDQYEDRLLSIYGYELENKYSDFIFHFDKCACRDLWNLTLYPKRFSNIYFDVLEYWGLGYKINQSEQFSVYGEMLKQHNVKKFIITCPILKKDKTHIRALNTLLHDDYIKNIDVEINGIKNLYEYVPDIDKLTNVKYEK
jgi:hypothetical protein